MKVLLMYKDQDFNLGRKLPSNEKELIKDLELNTLFNAMSREDEFLFKIAKGAVVSSLNDLDLIIYRQNILKDCLKNPTIVREIYNISVEALESMKESYFSVFLNSPTSILQNSIEMLQIFMSKFERIKKIITEDSHKFKSEGFSNLFAMLNKEFDDEFMAEILNLLSDMKFNDGFLFQAELGVGNKPSNYILCKTPAKKENLLERIITKKTSVYSFNSDMKFDDGFLFQAELGVGNKPSNYMLYKTPAKKENLLERIISKKTSVYSFNIDHRNFYEVRMLSAIKEQGLNNVANSLAQSVDYIKSFFNLLRTELAFYIGCLNLHEQLTQMGGLVSFPKPATFNKREHSFGGLYDISLALTVKKKIIANNLDADHKDLVIITGANQGGKSTFLRSVGLAQLMMQCGMFVAAESFSANIYDGLFTHYKREEDTTLKSGKLDEELSRMNDIVGNLTSNSLLLFNESFAATNEREGSEIAKQIISALLEKGVKIFFVTHLFEFAHHFYDQKMENVLFLRAVRNTDRSRTFKLVAGEPLETSFGEDLYKKIFEMSN